MNSGFTKTGPNPTHQMNAWLAKRTISRKSYQQKA